MAYTITIPDKDRIKAIWVGLVDVVPFGRESPLSKGAVGAFVNALAAASDSCEYKLTVEAALNKLNLKAIEFEDVESFRERSDRSLVSEDLYALARKAAETGAVIFSSFHNYFKES